jgi:hypothetical protein
MANLPPGHLLSKIEFTRPYGKMASNLLPSKNQVYLFASFIRTTARRRWREAGINVLMAAASAST